MSTYKGIKGSSVLEVAGDPPVSVSGQIWYNSSLGFYRIKREKAVGAFSTGGLMSTNRVGHGFAGTQTAGLAFMSGYEFSTNTESYNGTSWTELNNINTARTDGNGIGTQTAALAVGGTINNPSPPPGSIVLTDTEVWNGTNWTEVNNFGTSRYAFGAFGTNTAGLIFGGYPSTPTGVGTQTETWNGTNWTEVNDLTTRRHRITGTGIQTAGIAFGGESAPSPDQKYTESWNGTNWTNVGNMSERRKGCTASGSQSDAIAFGGRDQQGIGYLDACEKWNGSTWTNITSMPYAGENTRGGGSTSAAIITGGNVVSNPEKSVLEYDSPASTIETLSNIT